MVDNTKDTKDTLVMPYDPNDEGLVMNDSEEEALEIPTVMDLHEFLSITGITL